MDFKNLGADEEKALCAVLKSCRYLKESANWNVGENVLREVSQDIARDYAAMERATAKKAAQAQAQTKSTPVIDAGTF